MAIEESKPDVEMFRRIEALRSDFAIHSPTGKPFEHFFCPILLRDEPTGLCRAHIESEAFKGSNEWVPQRTDVDSLFGSAVEADLIAFVRDRGKDPFDLLLDRKHRRKAKPKFVYQGTTLEHYSPNKDAPPVPGHSLVQLSDGANKICDLAFKISPTELTEIDGTKIQLVVEGDFRASAIAYALKAAHLTMFKIHGYRYIFSPSGSNVVAILRGFVEKYKKPAKCSEAGVEAYFREYENMVAPLFCDSLQGTVIDNRVMSCFASSDAIFAFGVIVNAGSHKFCVFLPGMDRAINIYFDFINEPPKSISARPTEFQRPNEEHDGCWVAQGGEAWRCPLKQKFDFEGGRPTIDRRRRSGANTGG